ncbi:MAG: hypothetical protein KBC83_01365 [Candidatus Moranbacteria bacterium]|jgi:hypothetical protein|nr:hypothetical protein [Candidatus Moranbacteria bacterium]MBP9801298.1 hypothetical protein [Candidatus Moranbacteria bacterium]
MKIFFGVSVGIFCILLIFWGVYNFGFKNNPNVATVSESGTIIKEASPLDIFKASTNITPIIQERVLSAATDGRSLFFYSLDEQAFRQATLNGKDRETLLSNLPGIPTRIVWSPSREKALVHIKLSDNSSLWHTADLTLKTLIPLKPEMTRVVWDNTGSKIFYQYTDPKTGARSLNIASPDGKDWKNITALGTKEFFLAPVPSSVLVSFWQRPGAREKGSLSTVALTGGISQTILSDRFGADFLWSPTGNQVLVSTTDSSHPEKSLLSIMNATGGELRTLENAVSFIGKATWSKNGHTIYYALPGSLPESTILPNDYYEKNLHSQDSFWRIDTKNNKTERLVDLKDLTEAYDASELFLSSKEDSLYFIERKSQKLYQIEF